jgi:uncharacterized membrane protein
MTANGWLQIGLYLILLLAITKPLGVYMARVFSGEKTFMDPMLRPIERLLYRMTGVDETHEMRWTEYGTAMLLLSVVSMILLYFILRVQRWLPWNPQHFGPLAPDLAFNTAASFTTNTNWQAYSGETTMSYFTQMAGLAYHNFLSAATGIALAIAVIRGITRREMQTIGNFWVDLTRTILWVLLPACIVVALFLVSQGTVQSLKPYVTAKLVDPQTVQVTGSDGKTTTQHVTEQSITLGPVASQEVIKMYGTNGGGFFNANSAHPFENPTPLTNFVQMLLIFAIGSGLTYTLGRMTGSQKHGWAVWSAMAALFVAGTFFAYRAEARGNPELRGLDQHVSATQPGGKCELRSGERRARFVYPTRRNDSDDQHDARRDRVWRRWGGSLRYRRVHHSDCIHRGTHGGQDARISRQENRSVRREDGNAGRADFFAADSDSNRDWVRDSGWKSRDNKPGTARFVADFIRIHVGRSEQRFSVRGPECEYALVQLDDRVRHAVRKIFHGASGAGDCGQSGKEENRARNCGHVSSDHSALCNASRFRDFDRGSADVFPGSELGANSGAPADARRESIWRIGDECGNDDDS